MVAMIMDSGLESRLIAERQLSGADRFDEVWEGIYVMAPQANNEHNYLAGRLYSVLFEVVEEAGHGTVYPTANISDREENWRQNFRCPDALVFLLGNLAEDRDTHWFGGPDFDIEIVSPHDRTYEKLDFYASIGTREVLIVDREPWQLVLFRLRDSAMVEVGRSTLDDARAIDSQVVPLSFALSAGERGPQIELRHHDGQQSWTIKSA
jgi:Uma2 family endonuclease